MFEHFRDMSIQNKLFGALALTILTAALSVITSLGTLLAIQNLSIELVDIYQEVQGAYQAQVYLQELERTERSFILNADLEQAYPFLVYLALFDDYLRQALLKASTPEVKNALFEIDRAKKAYVSTFEKISKAFLIPERTSAEESGSIDAWIETTTLEMANMSEQIFTISQVWWQDFELAVARQGLFMNIAMAVNIFSLLMFLLLSTFAIFVISRGVFAQAAVLSQAAQAVAEKRFELEMIAPALETSDETGQLARAFAQMVAAVEAQEAELQAQIDEARARLESTRTHE